MDWLNLKLLQIGRLITYLSPLRPVYQNSLSEATRKYKENRNSNEFYNAEKYEFHLGRFLLRLLFWSLIIFGVYKLIKNFIVKLKTKFQ